MKKNFLKFIIILVGIVKFNQMPNLYTIIGLGLIIFGVLMVNLIGKTNN